MRRNSLGYREKCDALRGNLMEEDLRNLAYVDRYGKNDIEMTFLYQKSQRMRRYHMRYTRGWESSEDHRVKLSTLFIDKAAIQKDTLGGKLRSIDITNEDREEIQQELDLIESRLGSDGCKVGLAKE